jgi:hypothetical protein
VPCTPRWPCPGQAWSGCRDLKVYRYLLVCSLERQLEGTDERVQAGQELQCELFLLRGAFFFVEETGVPDLAAQVAAAAVVFGIHPDWVLPTLASPASRTQHAR